MHWGKKWKTRVIFKTPFPDLSFYHSLAHRMTTSSVLSLLHFPLMVSNVWNIFFFYVFFYPNNAYFWSPCSIATLWCITFSPEFFSLYCLFLNTLNTCYGISAFHYMWSGLLNLILKTFRVETIAVHSSHHCAWNNDEN